jgi:hypothetical protein
VAIYRHLGEAGPRGEDATRPSQWHCAHISGACLTTDAGTDGARAEGCLAASVALHGTEHRRVERPYLDLVGGTREERIASIVVPPARPAHCERFSGTRCARRHARPHDRARETAALHSECWLTVSACWRGLRRGLTA